MSDDDRVLQQLAQALVPGPAEPSEEEIVALRRAVSRHFGERPAPRPFWALPRWGRKPSGAASFAGRRPVAMVLAAAALAAGVAVVAGPRVSSPAGTAAHAEALPADSPELVETREAMTRVQRALAAEDKGSVELSSADLRRHLEHLNEGDLRAVGGGAPALLIQADAFVTVVVDTPGPVSVRVMVGPRPSPAPRQRPAPESTCKERSGEEEAQGASLPWFEPDEDADEGEPAEGREQAERAAERAERDAERAKRDAERAKRDAERAKRDAERLQRDRERARESVAREAERARREGLKEAAKAREEAMQQAAKARGEAMQQAAKARGEAMREALKAIAKARQDVEKEARKIRKDSIRIEHHDEGHEGHGPSRPRRKDHSEEHELEAE